VNEQALDLRAMWAILRRRSAAVAVAAMVGALMGVGLLFLFPPEWTSNSSVLLPTSTQPGSGRMGGYEADTQILIAGSTDVLARAGQAVTPQLSASEVENRLSLDSPASAVLRFTASGQSAEAAEALADAAAASLVGFLGETSDVLTETERSALQERADTLTASLNELDKQLEKTSQRLKNEDVDSAQGRADAAALAELTANRGSTVLELDSIKKQLNGDDVTSGQVSAGATVIHQAAPAERPDLVTRAVTTVGGAVLVAILGAVVWVIVSTRRDMTLRTRDSLANAIDVPVVASVHGHRGTTPQSWSNLLDSYVPDNVDGWALRQLIRRVSPGSTDSLVRHPDLEADFQPVVIISMSRDRAAMSAAPQIASFAASIGIKSELVAAQAHEDAEDLFAACSRPPGREQVRPGLTVGIRQDVRHTGDLVVLMAVLDRRNPDLFIRRSENAVTLLAVGPGTATAEDLAGVAVACAYAHHPLDGIVVVDPDPLDHTTGRLGPVEPTRPAARNAPLSLIDGRATGQEHRPGHLGNTNETTGGAS
jgi:capsular polysaccharide biosynthesis protein